MLKKYLIVVAVLLAQQVMAQTVNHVRTWDAKIPITDPVTMSSRPVTEVMQTTGFVDGLGRPLQMVVKEGSLSTHLNNNTKTDMVSYSVYDDFGREVKNYLPYSAATNTGNLKTDPVTEQYSFYSSQLAGQGEIYFYSNSDVEASPLNRATKTFAPGNNWVGANRGVAMNYLNNTTADDVKIWNVNGAGDYGLSTIGGYNYYTAGMLIEMHTTDEHGNKVVEYKDKEGKVILKKVQVGATIGDSYEGWLCTYYVYDIYNNLRLVIQPRGVKKLIDNGWVLNSTTNSLVLDELCFRYEYDGRNRMSIKKVPGAAEVYMIYDKWDRLVLTQDGNLRSSNKWIFTKYDHLNRPVMTGFYINATYTTQSAMQNYVDGLMPTAGRFETVNGSTIGYTTTSSIPSVSNPDILTISLYDNYNWTSSYSSFTSMNTDNNSLFYATGSPLYAQAITPSDKTKGLMTGTITYVLNSTTGQKLVSSIFYDDRGRAIQGKVQNMTTGIDITTTQYNFSGQPLMSVLQHEKAGGAAQSVKVITKLSYDDLGRLKEIKKKVTQTLGSTTIPANPVEKTIVKNEYDKLGQLVTKFIAPEFNSNAGLEQLTYDYNIRGWLTSLNKDYLNGTSPEKYFGIELAYDKTTTVVSGTSYAASQYNGNITGTIWKTKGDGVNRQYDFGYDKVNRLLKGDFKQKNADNSWNNSIVNFNLKMGDGINYGSAYDENGNIKQMQQWGLKLTGSAQIDNLSYLYAHTGEVSNKLMKVTDASNDPGTKLGDFKDGTNGSDDYAYDVNGNLITDNNKKIVANTGGNGIRYNYLNLPEFINVYQKGGITYTYDASGNKLKKETFEDPSSSNGNKSISTVTHYINGLVYESKTTVPADDNSPDYSYKLLFTGHEEGRVRYKPAVGNIPADFAYDYFIKDHLGNVRMVLTDEVQQDQYPAATMEDDPATTEETFYSNLPSTREALPTGYPPNSPTGNAKAAKVRGDWTGIKIGPAMILKVMAGDKFNVQVNSWYKLSQGQTIDPPNGIISELFSALNNAVGGLPGAKGTWSELDAAGVFLPGATTFVNNQNNNSNNNSPRAYLNWILFDEQFNLVSSSSGFEQVPAESYYNNSNIPYNNTKLHTRDNMSVDKSGFLYIYVSNETPNVDVFFDNLQVTHVRGQILEETHFYPFGLIMDGISSKAAGTIVNKRKWNKGSELESNEFSDGSGLELYSTFYRSLDPQIGRFWQIDPKPSHTESMYSSMGNNPLFNNDPLGDTLVNSNDVKVAKKVSKELNDSKNKLQAQVNANLTKALKSMFSSNSADKLTTTELKNLDKQTAILGDRLKEVNTSINDLNNIIADKNNGYTFRSRSEASNGDISVNDQKHIVIDVAEFDLTIHEIRHANKFATGQAKVTWSKESNQWGWTYLKGMTKMNAEIDSYRAQYGVNPNGLPPSAGYSVSEIKHIEPNYIRNIFDKDNPSAAKPYKDY